jgi:protoporphyrinogen oxidase
MTNALRRSVKGPADAQAGDNVIKTLIESFQYPRRGPGMMWDAAAAKIEAEGGLIHRGTSLQNLRWNEKTGRWIITANSAEGLREFAAKHVISSAPTRELIGAIDPLPACAPAAEKLRYRDFITVALIVDKPDLFPDNWIYIHEPAVRVGRIQNYRSWSPWMVPDPDKACVGLEYFCFVGGDLWTMDDSELVALATSELQELGLVRSEQVERGFVMRVPKAYPIYDAEYSERVATIRAWLDTIDNLQQVGRNGLHRYNNSDHSMLTAMRAVDNVLVGVGHDLWAVNVESSYHEEDVPDEQPYRNAPETPELEALRR